jgi:hypothetical protein
MRLMANLSSVLDQLQQERRRLTFQLEGLSNALSALAAIGRRRSGMSAAGRARIAATQRLRWSKVKGKRVAPIPTAKRRKMSASAIARIRAAQKARWPRWRREQKRR